MYVVLAVSIGSSCLAQKVRKPSKNKMITNINTWQEGSITLLDRTILKGLVRYDTYSSILSFQDGEDTRTFIAKSVLSFTIYDEPTKHDRLFLSMDFLDADIGYTKMYFFEVLKDYKKFGILSKTDPFEVQRKSSVTNSAGGGATTRKTTHYSQTSTVFILDEAGTLIPYVRQVEGSKMSNGPIRFPESRNKLMSEKEVLIDYIGKDTFEKLVEFAKQQGFQFKIREDFIKILDYYDHVLEAQ